MPNAWKLSNFIQVGAFDGASEYRTFLDYCMKQSGQLNINSKYLLSSDDGMVVAIRLSLSEDTVILGIFEWDFIERHRRLPGCSFRQFSVCGGSSRCFVKYSRWLPRAFPYLNPPLIGSRGKEKLAARGSDLPQRFPGHWGRKAATRHLHPEFGV